MKNLSIAFIAAVSLLAAGGCKKKPADAPPPTAGSADTKAPEPTMAGSGSAAAPAAGSAAPAAGSADPAAAGSAAAPAAGSGSGAGSN